MMDEPEKIKLAILMERQRCAGIVQMARMGEMDRDFRSIISVINSGISLEDFKAEGS